MKSSMLAVGVLAAALLSGCVKEASFPINNTAISVNKVNPLADEESHEYTADEVLIKFRSGTPQTGIINALERIGGKIKEHVVTGAMKRRGEYEGFYVVQVPIGISVALGKVKGLREVEYAEPNYIYKVPEVQHEPDANDPYYSGAEAREDNLWGMMGDLTFPYQNHYASRAGEAWWDLQPDGKDKDAYPDRGLTTPLVGSRTVYVAVIDQGIEHEHREFYRPDGSNQIAVAYGKDLVKNDDDPSPDHSSEYHGTHIAGTIGAVGNNHFGVAGVCWEVSLISVRFLNRHGQGTAVNAAKALDYITDLKIAKGINIVATNNSWSGLRSKTLQDAITRSEEAGILFVVPAGNDNADNDVMATYPACYPNEGIVSVASITVNGTKSWFSNYGASTVDLAAPGSYIWSTVPVGSDIDATRDGLNNGIGWLSGTSMAAPHVTGAIALYAAAHRLKPTTREEVLAIKEAIIKSTRRTLSFEGKVVSDGRLDIHRAIKKDFTVLDAD